MPLRGLDSLSGFFGFCLLYFRFRGFGFRQAFKEDRYRRPAVHVAALMRALGVVTDEVGFQIALHFIDTFVEFGPPHDAEVFVEQGAVQAFDVTVRLWPSDLCGSMLNLFELQEQLVGMAVGPAAEFPSVVGKNRGDRGVVRFEGRQDIVVHHMHRGDRHLRRIEPSPGVPGIAVDHGLQIHFTDAFQMTDEERIHGHKVTGIAGFDMTFAELRAEAF